MKPLIQVQGVSQRFNTTSGEFLALQNVSFDIYEGDHQPDWSLRVR